MVAEILEWLVIRPVDRRGGHIGDAHSVKARLERLPQVLRGYRVFARAEDAPVVIEEDPELVIRGGVLSQGIRKEALDERPVEIAASPRRRR